MKIAKFYFIMNGLQSTKQIIKDNYEDKVTPACMCTIAGKPTADIVIAKFMNVCV